ncbi:ethylene-responsive transcription factor CRF4-like [Forsythia ovata]|uniref:Rhodopsin n=1 Tax=Forsythia ovata TaxID=205694 RepID=A0ABD1WEV6_9LAMI
MGGGKDKHDEYDESDKGLFSHLGHHLPGAYPPAPGAHPPQGYPPQGYPPSGYPPQGYPPQGYPAAGHPGSSAPHHSAEEAAMVYGNAAIKLLGPDALTNFTTPAAMEKQEINVTSISGYEFDKELHNVSFLTSILRFTSTQSSEPHGSSEYPVLDSMDVQNQQNYESRSCRDLIQDPEEFHDETSILPDSANDYFQIKLAMVMNRTYSSRSTQPGLLTKE